MHITKPKKLRKITFGHLSRKCYPLHICYIQFSIFVNYFFSDTTLFLDVAKVAASPSLILLSTFS